MSFESNLSTARPPSQKHYTPLIKGTSTLIMYGTMRKEKVPVFEQYKTHKGNVYLGTLKNTHKSTEIFLYDSLLLTKQTKTSNYCGEEEKITKDHFCRYTNYVHMYDILQQVGYTLVLNLRILRTDINNTYYILFGKMLSLASLRYHR